MHATVALLVVALLVTAVEGQEDNARVGTRLVADLMEMFAPGAATTSSVGLRARAPSVAAFSEDERALGVGAARGGGQQSAGPWSSLAREVMSILTVTPPTTTTTTTPPPLFGGLLERIPSLFKPLFGRDDPRATTVVTPPPTAAPPPSLSPSPLGLFTLPTLAPFTMSPLPGFDADSPLLGNLRGVFASPTATQAAPRDQIDTGGGRLDRLIVRQNSNDPTDFLSNLMGNKYTERGLSFEDGNLKLVNKRGNQLFGNDVGVHDRSVDVPITRWLDIANQFLGAAN